MARLDLVTRFHLSSITCPILSLQAVSPWSVKPKLSYTININSAINTSASVLLPEYQSWVSL